jgi:16S rRNA (guanine1516-N2)-methyltransferase
VGLIAVGAGDRREARRLAERFALPFLSIAPSVVNEPVLVYRDGSLALHLPGSRMKPLTVDFASGAVAHRWQHGGGAGRDLARAVGARQGRRPYILDCTGGLGQDAFLLAALGCKVRVVERAAAVAALLQDALRRARGNSLIADIARRIELCHVDARELLSRGALAQEVGYLDPMFPRRGGGRALSARPLQMLRAVTGDDQDATELLKLALTCLPRVVVKRPDRVAYLGDRPPDLSTGGTTARFDVYLRGPPVDADTER